MAEVASPLRPYARRFAIEPTKIQIFIGTESAGMVARTIPFKRARGGRCALLTAFLGTRVSGVLTGSASACTKVVSKHTSRIGATLRAPVDAMYAAGNF